MRYRGYYYDRETGLYYLQSRYYDPETGRFINADGLVDTGQGIHSQNMFAYCRNDPVNKVDPSGKISLWKPWQPMSPNYYKKTASTPSNVLSGGSSGGSSGGTKTPSSSGPSKPPSPSGPSKPPTASNTKNIVAKTIYGEEHGRTISYNEGTWKQGQQAVAYVLQNRLVAQVSYMGLDLETICTNGQFDGYFSGKRAYDDGTIDQTAWDYAYGLAEQVLAGTVQPPAGMGSSHLYFNANTTFQTI